VRFLWAKCFPLSGPFVSKRAARRKWNSLSSPREVFRSRAFRGILTHSLARLVLSLLVKFDVVGMRSALSRHKVDVRFGERPPFCRASIYFPFHVLSPCAGTRLFWRMFYYFAAAFQVCRPRAAVLLFVWLRTQHSPNPKHANRTPYKPLLSNRTPRKFQKFCLWFNDTPGFYNNFENWPIFHKINLVQWKLN